LKFTDKLIVALLVANCSIKPPPITFTQSQTSAEKQIVGEKKDLEDNEWLLASSSTSSSGSREWRGDGVDKRYGETYMTSARLLIYLGDVIESNMKKGIIGESYDGDVKFVPENRDKMNVLNEDEIQRLQESLKLVNLHRKIMLGERMVYERRSGNRFLNKLEKGLRSYYFNKAAKGQYVEISEGKWSRK